MRNRTHSRARLAACRDTHRAIRHKQPHRSLQPNAKGASWHQHAPSPCSTAMATPSSTAHRAALFMAFGKKRARWWPQDARRGRPDLAWMRCGRTGKETLVGGARCRSQGVHRYMPLRRSGAFIQNRRYRRTRTDAGGVSGGERWLLLRPYSHIQAIYTLQELAPAAGQPPCRFARRVALPPPRECASTGAAGPRHNEARAAHL